MKEYVSTFVTGFEEVVSQQAVRNGLRVKQVYHGLLRYEFDGKPLRLARMPFFNNTFAVIVKADNATFDKLAARIAKMRFRPPVQGGSFRVRFSKENQFTRVSGKVMALAENAIMKNCGMKADRLKPATEFWFILRSEGAGFFGQLLPRQTEKKPRKGELRPELAYLLCCHAAPSGTVCDPFAGYGAIPLQILKHFPFSKLLVNDKDGECAAAMQKTPLGRRPQVVISRGDGLRMGHVADKSVDCVVTDPPWGFYAQVDDIRAFWDAALRECARMLKPGGTAVLLTGRPEETSGAAKGAGLTFSSGFSTLVNGKKASVLTFGKAPDPVL